MTNYYPFVEVKTWKDYLAEGAELTLTEDEEETATTAEVIFLHYF